MLRTLVNTLLRMLLGLFLVFMAWAAGFAWFISQVPRQPSSDTQHTDAIVALTGGKGRIEYGVKLLKEGRASHLLISGVEEGITPGGLKALHQVSIDDLTANGNAMITLGHEARNTIGNALETAQFMRREHLQSLRLVTSNYHMPRALSELRYQMPDIIIIPDPVIPADVNVANWWSMDSSTLILLSEYHKMIAASLRHSLLRLSGETV